MACELISQSSFAAYFNIFKLRDSFFTGKLILHVRSCSNSLMDSLTYPHQPLSYFRRRFDDINILPSPKNNVVLPLSLPLLLPPSKSIIHQPIHPTHHHQSPTNVLTSSPVPFTNKTPTQQPNTTRSINSQINKYLLRSKAKPN